MSHRNELIKKIGTLGEEAVKINCHELAQILYVTASVASMNDEKILAEPIMNWARQCWKPYLDSGKLGIMS